jgi:regulator of sigma D
MRQDSPAGRLAKDAAAQDRRAGTKEMVGKLVAERTEMLSLFCRMAGLEPFQGSRNHSPTPGLLQEFCQVLVDYIAAGHFSLYERIVNGTERRREIATLAEQLYPRIAETTQTALDFNDKYDSGEFFEIGPSFQNELSRLGEELAARIEYEDRIINVLLARRD